MKKLVWAFALITLSQALSAQVFTLGANGEVLADGATLTCTETETDELGVHTLIPSHLFVKNNTESTMYVSLRYEILKIDNGAHQTCFPENCVPKSETGVFETSAAAQLDKGNSRDLESKWSPTAHGNCDVRYTLLRTSAKGTTIKEVGPSVTVQYRYGTDAVETPESTEEILKVGYFDLLGHECAQPAQGLYIEKTWLRDGRTLVKKVRF